jgi:hypothetical protein
MARQFMRNNDRALRIDRHRFACSGVFVTRPGFRHGSL